MSILLWTSISLGIFAGLTQILGYIIYFKKIIITRIKPNTASWSIWAFGSVLESFSYVMVTNDWVKNILPISCSVSAIILFLYCLKCGHFEKLSRFNLFLVVLDSLAIFVWWWYQSAVFANFLLILIAIISFIPIFIATWKDPLVEDALPWYVWAVAYLSLTLVVVLRWNKWEDLIYPLIFLILHVIVAFLALDVRRSRKVTKLV